MADVEKLVSHDAQVGHTRVRRAIPQRGRRTVGAWCFADHMGPLAVEPQSGLDVAPHPHYGLATVTWLVEGAALHRDSLGSEQAIRAGEVNLMVAGYGVAHSEEALVDYRGALEGIQLWVALSDRERAGAASFTHRGDLPRFVEGDSDVTLVVGCWAGTESLLLDSDLLGAEARVHGMSAIPLRRDFEHAVVALRGRCVVHGVPVTPGESAYLSSGLDETTLVSTDAVVMIIGGVPLARPPFMWWNFVGDSREDVEQAYLDWRDHSERFGPVASPLTRLEAPTPWWIPTTDA